MKMFKTVALLAFLLLAVMVPSAMAQDTPTYGLSDEDFAFFTAALASSSSASSFGFSYEGAMTGTGGAAEVGSVTYAGEGSVSPNGFRLTMSGDFVTEGEALPYATELLLVDNVLYVDLSGLAGSWVSLGESDIEMLGSQFGGMLPINPTDPSAMQDMASDPALMEAMMSLQNIDPESFTSVVRSDDGGSAVFTTTVNIGDALANEGVQALVNVALQQAAAQGGEMPSAEDMAQLPEGFANSTVVLTHTIDSATSTVSGFSLVVTLDLDPSAMGGDGEPGVLTISVNVGLSGYGDTFEYTAPESALPASELLGQFMGGMSS